MGAAAIMERWYALQSKPYKEHQVRDHMAARGLTVFLPALVRPRRRGQGVIEKPYFPSYLFVHVDLEATGISAIRYTPGLRRVVAFNDGDPTPVPDAVVGFIREKLAAMETFDQAGEPLEPGDWVVITSGPFKDYQALFDRRLSAQGRVRLLIDLLARQVPLETDLTGIRRIR